MKKNKVLKIVLIVLGALVVLLAAAALGVLFYLHSMAAGLPETLPDAPADSTQLTLTASAPQEGAGSVSAPAGSSASSGSADSRTESGSTASSGKQENAGTANSGTEKPASSSSKQEAAYE